MSVPTLTELQAEVERLRRWKAEATEVILGLQDVGKALGLRPGDQITGASGVRAAQRLTSRAEAAEAKVAKVEAALDRVDPTKCATIMVDAVRAALAGADR